MKRFPPLLSPARLLPLLCFVFFVSFVVPSYGGDWVHWRGPEQNGVSREKDLPDKFDPASGENVIWKAPYGGRTTPIVLNGRVYLINRVGSGPTLQERVLCFDDKDGKLVWEHRFNVFLTDIVADRLGWTTLVGDPETGNVYAHGTQGLLTAFSKDGKVLWEHSLTEEYGRGSGYGGRVTSPIIDGDLLLLSMVNASWGEQARAGVRFFALNKRTGDVVWWASTGLPFRDTFFSCPVVKVINGERLLISGAGDGGVHAFKVRTGEKVWSYVFGSGGINCSPVVDGTKVYIGHGEGSPDSGRQGRFLCVDAGKVKDGKPDGKPELVWKVDGVTAKFASPIVEKGRVYVCDDAATLHCYDGATGKQFWDFSYGSAGFGSPVLADGKIYVGEVSSNFCILKPGDKECELLHQQFFPAAAGTTTETEISGSPAVANGRVYFMTTTTLYCLGKKEHQGGPSPVPPEPKEPAPGEGAKATHLQVAPADVVLEPGESREFTVRLFDGVGRFLREVKAEWDLAPAPLPPDAPPPPANAPKPPPLQGEVKDGKLTVDKARPFQFGLVVAKAEGLTGSARVRVVPPLPIRPDFSKVADGRPPAGWINAAGKFAVQETKEGKFLFKLANNANAPVAKANTYFGKPTLTDYTIQADVMSQKVRGDMADGGVIANRYTLLLDGNKQRLRLMSWDAIPRVDETQTYEWKPDTWYTLKLTVESHGDKAVVRGKVWQRGQDEPKSWTVTYEDPVGNKQGSPGLYGNALGVRENAPGAGVYYDKVSVTPNTK